MQFSRFVTTCALFLLVTVPYSAHAQTAAAEKPKPAEAKPAPPVDMAAIFKLHWNNRVTAFRQQNEQLQFAVRLGDSITEGFYVAKYFPGRRVLYRGISADVIGNDLPTDDNRGVLKRLDESVFNCAATDVFLMIGINDLGSGHTPEVMEQGYRDVLQQIKTTTPQVRVHVQSLLPTRDRYAKHNANVLDFNNRLKKLAEEFGYDYVDVHALMADEKGELKADYTYDGLHLDEAAYNVWQAEIERLMKW
jgi:lysophospholipase L1-like esterase